MEIRLRTGNQIKNMSILNTYAPHNGYPSEVIQEYWNNVDAYISLIPISHIKIWCTDNNGQLTRNSRNESNVGPWAIGKKLENTNSTRLSATCEQNDLVACNTFFIPKIEK